MFDDETKKDDTATEAPKPDAPKTDEAPKPEDAK